MARSLVLAVALTAGAASVAEAHTATRSSIVASRDGREVTLRVEATHREIGDALGLDRGDTEASAAQIDADRKRVYRMLARAVRVGAGGERCAPSDGGLGHATRAQDYTAIQTIVYRCARRGRLEITYGWYFDRDPLHQAFVRMEGGRGGTFILAADRRRHALDLEPSIADNVVEFGRSGIEHIFTGYDHLMFLVALILMAGLKVGESGVRPGLGYAARVITGFTLGHSVTLVLAAVGIVHPNTRMIESGIAASIVYVAVENLLVARARPRALLTALFGLIHGFGFAGVLAEEGLPRKGLVLSLVSFNVGIELGQLAIVLALALPLAFVAGQAWFRARLLVPGSVGIAVFGTVWLAERVIGFKVLPI
ncbi:MAG: HupE/UreJ family protein [Deltaproteobacteria bacterium]|nr:HupE/UreJ family protein [Deltaproteobacteria bacterium]